MSKIRGKEVNIFSRVGVIRADRTKFGSFVPYLNNNIIAVKAYDTAERSDNASFYLIEGVVTELFQF
ncbi:hypothetical protein ACFL6Y_11570 [Elusimicrobiota bacterium]